MKGHEYLYIVTVSNVHDFRGIICVEFRDVCRIIIILWNKRSRGNGGCGRNAWVTSSAFPETSIRTINHER